MRPGGYRRIGPPDDPATDPETQKKLRSGFWSHEYRFDRNEDVWRCDKRGLEEAIYNIMRDRRESQFFSQDPERYLDVKFGEGTGRAWAHRDKHGSPWVDMRTPRYFGMDLAREKDMALYPISQHRQWTGTTSGATTTATAAASTKYDSWIMDHIKEEGIYKELKARQFTTKKTDPKIRFKKNLVRSMPFVNGVDGLLKTLQREFDHWAGDQMRLLHD